MSTTLDPGKHAEALKAAIKAKLGPNEAYDADEVPGTNGNTGEIPSMYAEIDVELDQPEPSGRRMAGQTAIRLWIVTINAVGTTVAEARWILARAAEALYERRLVVDDVATEPLLLQESRAPEWDNGRYSGLLVLSYGH